MRSIRSLQESGMKRALLIGLLASAACAGSSGTPLDAATCEQDGGLFPRSSFDAGFNPGTSIPNTIGVTFSGETLGISGLPFQPVNQGDPYFVDGWDVTFSEYIVVIANVRLNP